MPLINWFYETQTQAVAQMDKMYSQKQLVFQMINKDRVIAWYHCYKEGSPVPVTAIVLITKRMAGQHTYMIYEGDIAASN